MKTGKYYFGLLSETEQKRFKANCDENPYFEEAILREWDSFNHFINAAFTWYITPEGGLYWSEIANRKIDD